jgi:heptaprenyl diphosphate synthase
MFALGPGDTLCILLARVFLGSVFSGQMTSLLYSLAGGLLCYLVMLLLRRVLTSKQLWVCSVLGAMAHNVGQMTVAVLVTGTPALVYYLPVLMVSGILTGVFTGLCAQFVTGRLDKITAHKPSAR